MVQILQGGVTSPMLKSPSLSIGLGTNFTHYLILIGASSGYHNLKLDKKSSYLTPFACQFGRYKYTGLPFGVTSAGDMFQCKIDEIFKQLPNVFSIVDDILIQVMIMMAGILTDY